VGKDERQLIREAERQGWRIREGRDSTMLLAPDGTGKVTLHHTNSDHRALKNLVSIMRRHGFIWPPPRH